MKLRENEGEADNKCARKANRLEGKRKRKRLRASDIPIASCREYLETMIKNAIIIDPIARIPSLGVRAKEDDRLPLGSRDRKSGLQALNVET